MVHAGELGAIRAGGMPDWSNEWFDKVGFNMYEYSKCFEKGKDQT
jgi:hypothetical protein